MERGARLTEGPPVVVRGPDIAAEVRPSPRVPVSLASVVVPVRDAAATLAQQLDALSRQTYRGRWEVVVADNGSRDGSAQIASSFGDRLPGLLVADAGRRPGPSAARNAGAAAARGDVLAFCDADDVVGESWLEAMVGALQDHDFVSGAMDYGPLNDERSRAWGFASHERELPIGWRFLPFALSANLGVSRRTFDAIGGFDEDIALPAADDVDFSWRAQLAGYPLHFEPRAVVAYRLRSTIGELWRQHRGYGAGVPLLYRRFHARGMPPGSLLKGAFATVRLLARLPMLASERRRGVWVRMAAHRWGMLRGALAERVLYF